MDIKIPKDTKHTLSQGCR